MLQYERDEKTHQTGWKTTSKLSQDTVRVPTEAGTARGSGFIRHGSYHLSAPIISSYKADSNTVFRCLQAVGFEPMLSVK